MRTRELPFIDHIVTESAAFRAALAGTRGDERVPSCPDWSADDLLWHLTEVQWFWGEIVQQGIVDAAQLGRVDTVRPARAGSRRGLLTAFDDASARLVEVLRATAPETHVWMWHTDQSAGYIARRQAHEALIHRVDAELTAGGRTPLPCELATDGVDEAVRVMRGLDLSLEPGVRAQPLSGAIAISAVAAMQTWVVTPARFSGVDSDGDLVPDDFVRFIVHDQPDDAPDPVATVTATSADLDCWLWARDPVGEISRSGDPSALAALDTVIAHPIH